MNENPTVSVNLTLNDIQLLNDIIQNSTSSANFGTVSKFVGNVNKQIQDQLREIQDSQLVPIEPVAE